MSKKEPKLGTYRDHLEEAAEKGNQGAARELEGPEYPDVLAYLHEWALELHRARRAEMHGWGQITYGDIADWARLTGRSPSPREVSALLSLTTTMIHPPDAEDLDDG